MIQHDKEELTVDDQKRIGFGFYPQLYKRLLQRPEFQRVEFGCLRITRPNGGVQHDPA